MLKTVYKNYEYHDTLVDGDVVDDKEKTTKLLMTKMTMMIILMMTTVTIFMTLIINL